MQVPLPYLIARWFIRAALAIYFRGIDVAGEGNVPAKGPVILAANHPQSVTDALVLAAAAPRAVRFVAHSGLFVNPLRGWLLRSCGVIPVYRAGGETGVPDAAPRGRGAGDMQMGKPPHAGRPSRKNVEMFAACAKALENGGAIGIFPEGVSTGEPRLHRLKTGTARIALHAESQNDWCLGVSVIPVGLTFESRRRMRTRVFVSFGEPIGAARFRGAYEKDPVEASHSLSAELEQSISRLVVDIERAEFEGLVNEVDLIYKGELVARQGLRGEGHAGQELGHAIEVEIPRALDYFLERRPEVVWRVQRLLRDYKGSLDKARVRDDVLREARARTLGGEVARIAVLGAAGLPLALYGAVWNYVPYRFTGFVARGASKDETKIHYHQIVSGAVFYPLWYAPAVYLASRILRPWEAVIFAVSLPLAGLFALAYVRSLARRGRRLRYARVRMTHGRFARELERKRRLVIAEMDIALAEYLAARLDGGAEPVGEDRGT